MVKDLRTKQVSIRVGKLAQLASEDESKWGLYQTQTFIPPLETLFKTELVSHPASHGIRFVDPIQKVVSADTILTASGKTVQIHRKTTSIMNPFRWMRGDYGSLGLPATQETSGDTLEKLQNPNTAAYVGAMASIVLSESDCPNFPKVYGVYCGMARSHEIDISDDFEDLSERPWFPQNIGKTFEIRMRQNIASPSFQHTRGQRVAIELGEDAVLGNIDDIAGDRHSTPSATSIAEDAVDPMDDSSSDADDTESTASTEDLYAIESCDCSSDASSFCEDDGGEEAEPFAWAELSNVPVVTTVMEKCSGTFYELIKLDTDPSHHVAFMAQVVFALAYAQRTYGLTHNDLHGNNVMFVRTEQTHLNYSLDGTPYRVPTHGYLLKIIDFDRAVFGVRLQGMREQRVFMSDQFKEDEEAGGQYNSEPFYNSKVPEFKPNPSFDLVRLATSLFWDLFPEGPDGESGHPLKSVLIRWMTLPDQTSVLFGKKNARHDRYHGFEQYKAIARYCKDTAIPRKEPLLSGFKVDKFPLGEQAVIIDP